VFPRMRSNLNCSQRAASLASAPGTREPVVFSEKYPCDIFFTSLMFVSLNLAQASLQFNQFRNNRIVTERIYKLSIELKTQRAQSHVKYIKTILCVTFRSLHFNPFFAFIIISISLYPIVGLERPQAQPAKQ